MRKCCNFKNGDGERLGIEVSCSHVEQLVDELNLSPNIRAAHPPHLPLPNHVHGLSEHGFGYGNGNVQPELCTAAWT